MDGNFSNKIFFSDEPLFTLGRYINKQNCRIWDSENLQVIEERPLHPEKVTFWYALWSECVIGWDNVENDFKRINVCNTSRGGRLNNVMFHT